MPENQSEGDRPEDRVQVEILDDLDGVARAAADLFMELAQAVTAGGGVFNVALSGGTTPRALNELLATSPYLELVDWSKVHFFWGDERLVPPDDAESNYRMARETLLSHLPVSENQIHRIPTELGDPEAVASRYEEELQRAFQLSPGQLPQFDLIFLGMGPDGHTASLFPHTAGLEVTDRLVIANYVPRLASYRITLTAPVINEAAVVVFLAAGSDKAAALASVLEGPRDPDEFPAQRISPVDGDLYWLVDRAAAAEIRGRSPDTSVKNKE
jgi:6-phosphogluconolactonase